MIKHAAILQDNIIYVGRQHSDCLETMAKCELEYFDGEQGFVTDKGEFVGRHEAFVIATRHNQITRKHGQRDVLYSEDLFRRERP